jgi:hypothetical protein
MMVGNLKQPSVIENTVTLIQIQTALRKVLRHFIKATG